MSHGQPRRPQAGGQDQPMRQQGGLEQDRPIRYGDVFNVSGDLATRTVALEDANMMQSAENTVLGQAQNGGPAAPMQSAATRNEQAGFVSHRQTSDAAADQGVTVTETDIPGARVVTESVAGQVVGQFVEPTPARGATVVGVVQSAITIGEALEATAQTTGNKPVDQSDAAAIQAAEARANGSTVIILGGLAASAQSAANYNAAMLRDEDKVKISAVLTDATAKLPSDKLVTRADAEGFSSAEKRNNPNFTAHPGGVAASLTAAARLNENVNV